MIETWYNQDLQVPVTVQYLDGNVFSQDNLGNLIGVNVFDGGAPASISGTVSANIIRADGVTVPVTGSLSGNTCYIILPSAAYAVPGPISIIIKLTGNGSTTTICAIVANVYQSSTDAVVDPGTILPSIDALINVIETTAATIPADYSSLSGYEKNILVLESGTYSDADGTTKTSNSARQRNKSPLYIGNVAGIVIPSGYECWVQSLDATMTRIGSSTSWTNTYFNIFNCPNGTEYINIIFRSISSPSGDISNNSIIPRIIWQGAKSSIPRWNVSPYGIYIDGFDVVVNQNGFGIIIDKNTYYIAPTDLSSVTRFTPSSISDPWILVIDITKLTNGVRTNPSAAMKITNMGDRDLDSGRYAVVAQFYSGMWSFCCGFTWMNKKQTIAVNGIMSECHIIAHKGGNAAEANTIANFIAAYQAGYKAVECDVQFTSDGVMVLEHDDSFIVNGVTYVIASNTYADLVAVKPNLAKFEELLILCKRTNMIIDVDFTKTYTTEQTAALYDLISSMGAQSRCFITCFANTARQLLGYEPLAVCISQVTTAAAVDSIRDIINRSSVCICSISYSDYTTAQIKYIHSAGALVKVWTVNDADDAKTYFAEGADMVISDSLTDSIITDL